MKSIIQYAESVQIPSETKYGPPIIQIWQKGPRLESAVLPAVQAITGSVYPWYMDQFDIPGWLEWRGDFSETGFELTEDLSLTLHWRQLPWDSPECFVCIERPHREVWVWSSEDIARRIFWEGFSMIPAPFDRDRMRSASSSPSASPTSTIRRTTAVTHPSETAPIASPGWDFASISAPCFN